jgi:5'-deoxynucleotidase YfbR-like HD superfamily hydrolase
VKIWERGEITSSARLAGQVLRYHTWPTHRQQTVGEHVWQVMRIYVHLFGSPASETWEYILHHDTGEIVTGDIPFPLKSENHDLKVIMDKLEDAALEKMPGVYQGSWNISAHTKWKVKICDLLEMMEFGLQEEALGNRFAAPITKATAEAVRRMTEAPPEGVRSAELTQIKLYTMSTLNHYKGERTHVVGG